MWLTPLLVFLPFRLLLPFFYLSCAALLQYGKWFPDWRWFGFGINPFLARDILQFVPAALMLVVLGCFRKSFSARPIARAHSLLPDMANTKRSDRGPRVYQPGSTPPATTAPQLAPDTAGKTKSRRERRLFEF